MKAKSEMTTEQLIASEWMKKQYNLNNLTAVEKLIAKYKKQWDKYGMGSVISYSQVVSDLEKLKKVEKEQHQETWDAAHQAGRFEGKGIAEKNWQTFEGHWEETYTSQQNEEIKQ